MPRPQTLASVVFAALAATCCAPPDGSEDDKCGRWVLVDHVTNARDLNGYQTDQGKIGCRRVMRGGALCGVLDAGCTEFDDLGIRTVVDLRESGTQQTSPASTCVQEQATLVDAHMPKLDPTAANYLALLDESDAVAALFTALGAAGNYPVYIHCVIGRDRASVATALVLLALGVERGEVEEEFTLSNKVSVEVDPAWIAAVLDEVEARGGVETYLSAAGVTSSALDVLRSEAVANP
jgi:protein-tyrosine phosphatase